MLYGFVQIQCMNVLLEDAPVSVSLLKAAVPLMGTIATNACHIEIVTRVGWVHHPRGMRRNESGVLPEGVVLLPVYAV